MAFFKKSYFCFPGVLVLVLFWTSTGYAELTSGMDADVVIGEPDFVTDTTGVSQTQFNQPRDVFSDGQRLFVSDSRNGRVLIYNSIPRDNFAAADVVLGQNNFSTRNFGTSQTLMQDRVCGVFSDRQRLFVADAFNNRVLIWNGIPSANGTPPSIVLGQATFITSGVAVTQSDLSVPRAVYSDGKRLIVSDWGNNRVLIWNSIPTTNKAPADIVLGQPNFTSNSARTTRNGMSTPWGVTFDGQRLYVADQANSRVLIWNSLPTVNNALPDVVLGQPNFNTAVPGAGPQRMDNPISVASNGKSLFVADINNSRILVYNSIPTSNFQAADAVIGQPDLDNKTTGLARNRMNAALGISFDGRRLLVADQTNSRVLLFNIGENAALDLGPQFNQGKGVLGKVFNDVNSNGTHYNAEKGMEGIKIASDTGIYAITDEDGKYHFPYIETGQRILKIDEATLPEGSIITTESPRKTVVTEGILTKISFGVKLPPNTTTGGAGGEASAARSENLHEHGGVPQVTTQRPSRPKRSADRTDGRPGPVAAPLLKTTLSQDPVLLKPTLSIEAKLENNNVVFTIQTNYHLFIESSEIMLYTKDLTPFKKIPLPKPIPYQYTLKKEELPPNQETLHFQLSVKDKQGREDRTGVGSVVLF